MGAYFLISPRKGGGEMSTYSELLQTINIIIAVAGLILNVIKLYRDIKKK